METRLNPCVHGLKGPKIKYDLYKTNSVLNNKKKQRSVKKQKSKLVYIILMLFILSATIILRYSQITEYNYEIGKNKEELSILVKENENIKAEIEKNTNLEEIKEIAINELNMRRPYKHQIEYVRIEKKDYTVEVNKYKKLGLTDTNILTLLIKNVGRALNIFN